MFFLYLMEEVLYSGMHGTAYYYEAMRKIMKELNAVYVKGYTLGTDGQSSGNIHLWAGAAVVTEHGLDITVTVITEENKPLSDEQKTRLLQQMVKEKLIPTEALETRVRD